MRAIEKGCEPPRLTAHRDTCHSDYDNYPREDKDALRHALVVEQRGLCCYCMGRIRPSATGMKIEHWRCQTRYREEQLDYQNLLGACLGGEGQPLHRQHCDTRKRDLDLLWNPADPSHKIEARVKYLPDGTIKSNDEEFNTQLNEVLNLNFAVLKNHRKRALRALSRWLEKQPQPVPQSQIEHQRNKFNAGNGNLTRFRPVTVWWLDQKLAMMARRR